MTTTFARGSCLRVARFRATYFVTRDHPAPERLKGRLDDALGKSLPEALAGAVARWFSDADESVWLIRRLDLDLDINAAWDREQLAKSWAGQFARALAAGMRADGDGQNVIRFPDRAAYLAAFLGDLADSSAWGRWYYESFEGLRPLPLSAALRTAVCERAGEGLTALLLLPRHGLGRVLRALSPQDARRVLESVTGGEGLGGDEGACLDALWAAWGREEAGAWGADGEGLHALRLCLAVCGERRELATPALRNTARALVRLARRLGDDSGRRGERLLKALAARDLAALYEAAGTGDAEVLAALMRCPAGAVAEIGRSLRSEPSGAMSDEAAEVSGPRDTPFGGIFLLLPLLDEMPLEEATAGWPEAEGTRAAAVVRLLLLAGSCGRARARLVFSDALARDLLRIAPALTPRAIASWQKSVGPSRLRAFAERLDEWRREGVAIGRGTLALVRVPLRGGGACLLVDVERGAWLCASASATGESWGVGGSPRAWLERASREGSIVLAETVFAGAAAAAFPSLRVVELEGDGARALAEENGAVAEFMARRPSLADDLRWLSWPGEFQLSRPFAWPLRVAAQGLLRAFARRLTGFAGSGLGYLYANFLDFPASLEEEMTRRVVRVGRPPLNLILSMAGVTRCAYTAGWLDARPFEVFQEG